MEILKIIDELEDLFEGSVSVPLSGKCIVDRMEVLEIVRKLRLKVPDEVQDAIRIIEDRENIIKMAEVEAQRIINSADDRFDELVDDHEIISAAYKKANEIVSAAQVSAHEIKKSSFNYVENLLEKAETALYDTIDTINANRNEMQSLKG